jgi:hypothetical protein
MRGGSLRPLLRKGRRMRVSPQESAAFAATVDVLSVEAPLDEFWLAQPSSKLWWR